MGVGSALTKWPTGVKSSAIELLDPYLDDRVLVVSTVYLASLLIRDVTPWKACVLVAAVYGFLILKIGQRWFS